MKTGCTNDKRTKFRSQTSVGCKIGENVLMILFKNLTVMRWEKTEHDGKPPGDGGC